MRFALVMSEVGTGLRRNFSMVVSVVLVTFISLTFVGAAILLQFQIGQMKGYWYDRAQVAIYMCTNLSTESHCNLVEATKAQKDAVEAELKSPALQNLVKTVSFENHNQVYAEYKAQFGDTTGSDFVTPAFLPETFWVNLKDPSQADAVVESISGLAGVEQVKDQRKYLDPIFNALNAASFTAVGIAALMLIAAVLLIATTIRLSAFSRRRETGIMRLVGASKIVIQLPFILEGVIAAVIGAALASGTLWAVAHFFLGEYMSKQYPDTAFISPAQTLLLAPALIGLGVVLAGTSSLLTLRRYLRV